MGLNRRQKLLKRLFDLIFSIIGLLIMLIPISIFLLLATISTKKNGLYTQKRVGKNAKLFTIYKIRTMHGENNDDFITLKNDEKITVFGAFLRKYKLDELPQIFNVLIGNMSFVGPRPDVSGYADQLKGSDRIILSVNPGITGPATLKFRNEEELLAKQENPLEYNNTIIWKEKIRINKEYVLHWTFTQDIKYIYQTIFN